MVNWLISIIKVLLGLDVKLVLKNRHHMSLLVGKKTDVQIFGAEFS